MLSNAVNTIKNKTDDSSVVFSRGTKNKARIAPMEKKVEYLLLFVSIERIARTMVMI